MKKTIIMLVLAVAACTSITAQNFERAVPLHESNRGRVTECRLDYGSGLYIERREGRISSIYNDLVWVEIYDRYVTTYVRKAYGWSQTVESIDRVYGQQGGVVAMGVTLYGLNRCYEDVTVRIGVGPQFTTVTFQKPGMASKNFSVPVPEYYIQERRFPERRHNPHPGYVRY